MADAGYELQRSECGGANDRLPHPTVTIRNGVDDDQTDKTLVHELAHTWGSTTPTRATTSGHHRSGGGECRLHRLARRRFASDAYTPALRGRVFGRRSGGGAGHGGAGTCGIAADTGHSWARRTRRTPGGIMTTQRHSALPVLASA